MKRESTSEKRIVDGITVNISVSNAIEMPQNWWAAFLGNQKAYDAALQALKVLYVNKLITGKYEASETIKEVILQFEIEKKKFDDEKWGSFGIDWGVGNKKELDFD